MTAKKFESDNESTGGWVYANLAGKLAEVYYFGRRHEIYAYGYIDWGSLDKDEAEMAKRDFSIIQFSKRGQTLIHNPPFGERRFFRRRTKFCNRRSILRKRLNRDLKGSVSLEELEKELEVVPC
jgi:hypothetical protein